MLPLFEQSPGPLHTILQDPEGNIYYTDEINHMLSSLTATGELRWYRRGPGTGQGDLHYPKGAELGWITAGHGQTRCIAVCDSWNRRVQFFDLHGGLLGSWQAAGDLPFSDVVDIRFIHAGLEDENGSCWLVLDRGHQCLLGLDLAGRQLFRIGRPFSRNLESCWPTPDSLAAGTRLPIDLIRECSSFDPLFMPLRIFGSSRESLFIWEPNPRRLKHVLLGNLLPVWIGPPSGAEWIAADIRGLLAFDRVNSLVCSYESEERIWQSTPVEGIPVPSGRSADEVWLQNGPLLHHLVRARRSGTGPAGGVEAGAWLLSRRMDEIEHVLGDSVPTPDINQLQEVGDRLCRLSRKALDVPAAEWSNPALAAEATENLASLQREFSAILSHMQDFSCTLFLIFLKLQGPLSLCPSWSGQEHVSRALSCVAAATRPIVQVFEQLVLFRDEWLLTYVARTETPDGAPESVEKAEVIRHEHSAAIMKVMVELSRWLWFVPVGDALAKMPLIRDLAPEPEGAGRPPLSSLARPHAPAKGSSGHLRELDRIFLGGKGMSAPAFPAAIAHTLEMDLLVTLHNSDQVVRLDGRGRILGTIGGDPSAARTFRRPLGIATDVEGRIWVSEPQCNCIKIFDPGTSRVHLLEELTGGAIGLKYPTGLYRAVNGKMLVADTQNNRILAVGHTGGTEILFGHMGSTLGKLKHPIWFCDTNVNDTFWVVDLRNHRLQELRLDGEPVREIGGVGLGMERLVLPESAAVFDDGVLIVDQWACTKALKVFSPDGKELETILLDYSPRGMLAHQGLLLVCEGYGDHLRVYERR